MAGPARLLSPLAHRPPPLRPLGRKRHVAVDTGGLLLDILVTPASTQDRDGGRPLLWRLRRHFPTLRLAVDYERKPEHHQAWVQWAMVRVMVKRLTQQAPALPTRTLSLAA